MPNHVHKLGNTQEEALVLFKKQYRRLSLERRLKKLIEEIEEDLKQIKEIIEDLK